MAISYKDSLKSVSVSMAQPMAIREMVDTHAVSADTGFEKLGGTDYDWIDQFTDEKYSSVDELKNVKLGDGQINITAEENSQVIPFELPRRYDNIDLSKMLFNIHYVTASGYEGLSKPINFMVSENKIRFYWLLDANCTIDTGFLAFEIIASGSITYTNAKGNQVTKNYIWKTKPNKNSLNVLESLSGNGQGIEPSEGWTVYLQQVSEKVTEATNAADQARAAAIEAQDALGNIDEKINNISAEIAEQTIANIQDQLSDYITKTDYEYDKTKIDAKIEANTDQISNIVVTKIPEIETKISNTNTSFENYKTENDEKVAANTTALSALPEKYYNKEDINQLLTEVSVDLSDYYNRDEVDNLLKNVKVDLTEYYTKTETNALLTSKANQSDLSKLTQSLSEVNDKIDAIGKDPAVRYTTTYDSETGEFILWEIAGDDDDNRTEISKHIITGGGGGGTSSASTITISRVTPSPYTLTKNDPVIIEYEFTSVDSSGEDTGEGTATWKVGNKIVDTTMAIQGRNQYDITKYLTVGSQKVTLSITDSAGSMSTKSWTVQIIDLYLESTFDDSYTYPLQPVQFSYTPYGAIQKTLYFILDGSQIGIVATTTSGLPLSYEIPVQTHGAHLLEVYAKANLNNTDIETNHIYKDIIWYDSTNSTPVIGCVHRNLTVKQYDTANITFAVYDPKTDTPNVTIKLDDEVVSKIILESPTYTYAFKSADVGSHTLKICCGDVEKTINIAVEKLDIDVAPVTANLAFDFNPVGYSNGSADRLWSDKTVDMAVSENFDWVNGGYQIDKNGDQYFCVKSGTTATINYNLFADDPKKLGKEFKVIFKTTNVKRRDTSFITCMNDDIGLDMKIESANIHSSNNNLYSPYCEDDIIEFEFNINKDTEIPMVLTYEDGTPNRPMIYTGDSSFKQNTPVPITIGSENCDVHIYRMKAYSASLSNRDVLSNFIADARNAEEMVSRYNRNQIYDENGALTPEILAKKCPDLRVIIVDAPWFTNDKSNKVADTTIQMIYENGDPILDNWTCVNASHSGQGTSSNEYGYAGRNLDLIMNGDKALFTFGDGTTTGKTITLTRNSVPTNYLNCKVNIASSENENNAQFARRYNEYNPFKRTAKLKDSKVKDTMEFYNCAIFVRENNEDISTHREFQDTNVHFYAIGNVGDSKKTDNTRVNDKNDAKEHVIEIMDYNVALAEFPTGKTDSEGNKIICPVSEWQAGNAAYDYLYAPYKYEDGKFKSFGSESYEFRYEKKGITEEERQINIDAWREAYKFVVTSDDETFIRDFDKYFVKDSILFFYLFTERYLCVDNRAKNAFVHYGKVWYTSSEAASFKETYGVEIETDYIDETQGTFNDGYRYDLAFFYDSDTSLGIDNTGKLVLTYGQEDTDYYVDNDPASGYVYRAAESTFFCRVRDLFASELQAMFVDRENANAWSADGLISQWDNAQAQFPEELRRLDIQRKYLRTYQGISIDNSIAGTANPRFLTEMLNGFKKYQRRMFERNQELYMATKYFGNRATQDQIMMRFNNPIGVAVKPDFTLKLTPYSNMYIGVKFGNISPINIRAKAGIEYTIPYELDTADITLIYGASFIQEISDLSKCYVGDNDFSKASRLQRLELGSDNSQYSNTYMTKISLGNNALLEYLDIRRITGLNSVVDLSKCNNLIELHAENSGATGILFSNGGKLKKAYIPAVSSLTAKNLNYLEEFEVENYDNLRSLIIENTPFINTYNLVNSSANLNIVRLIGINWDSSYHIADSAILDRLLKLRGVDNNGYETDVTVLTGNFYATILKQKMFEIYQKTWKDLTMNCGTMVEQFEVQFINANGELLETQYVDKGETPVDPITRKENPLPTPTLESTVSTDFTYKSWDKSFTPVFANQVYTTTYIETTRVYTIKHLSNGVEKQIKTAPYGSYVTYDAEIPTYTSEESGYKYYLFSRWDKSGYVDGDKTINAVFDSCQYTDGYYDSKDLSTLRPVEIYMLTQLSRLPSAPVKVNDVVEILDTFSFTTGHDFDYDDVESITLFEEPMEFTGSNYHDTGIKLFEEDKDFIIAIDYKFDSGNGLDATLMQCYAESGKHGFKLSANSGVVLSWGDKSSDSVATLGNREMLVLRHVKGENGLHVYKSNLQGTQVSYVELDRDKVTSTDSDLVFGCKKVKNGQIYDYEKYAKGTIFWGKMWYSDLGDEACKQLAFYIHEEVICEMHGTNMYFLSDVDSTRSSMTFLSKNCLYSKRNITSGGNNTGGWEKAMLNAWLNSRFFNGIPTEIKQLIKKVDVLSSAGNRSTETTSSACHIYIPAVYEVASTYYELQNSPYKDEAEPMTYFTDAESRIRTDANGTAMSYLTRSPNAQYGSYYYYIDESGQPTGFATTSSSYGIVIEFSI